MSRCIHGFERGLHLCPDRCDRDLPVHRTKIHTVKRSPRECEANPFRRGKAVKGAWPNGYRIGEQSRG